MTVLQIVALLVVALGGGLSVFVHDPLRQTFVLSIYGLALMFLFFAFQAPDVALSEVVVGTIGLPLIIFAALRKIAERERTIAREKDTT